MLKAPGYGCSGEAGAKLRHVVFIDRSGGRKRAVNLAPAKEDVGAGVGVASQATPNSSRQTPQEIAFIRWLFNEAGLESGGYGELTLARRLPSCLRVLRAPNVTQAREWLQ